MAPQPSKEGIPETLLIHTTDQKMHPDAQPLTSRDIAALRRYGGLTEADREALEPEDLPIPNQARGNNY